MSTLARFMGSWLPRCSGRQRSATPPEGPDVLWHLKRRNFFYELAEHGLSAADAYALLRVLATNEPAGYPINLSADVLDRVLPLLGLLGLVSIEDRWPEDDSAPRRWVRATEYGLRYAKEIPSETTAA